MSFTLYFTGVLTGWCFAAYVYSALYDATQHWRSYWIGAAGGLSAVSALYFAGFENGVVATYYLTFLWLVVFPIHHVLSHAPASYKIPWFIQLWFYGVPPFLGVRCGLQVMQYVVNRQDRGFEFWSGSAANISLLTIYILLFRRVNRDSARERALVAMFPDMEKSE